MKYIVHCTKIYNGSIVIDADSEEYALRVASQKLDEETANIDWEFGEETADYAEECDEEYD